MFSSLRDWCADLVLPLSYKTGLSRQVEGHTPSSPPLQVTSSPTASRFRPMSLSATTQIPSLHLLASLPPSKKGARPFERMVNRNLLVELAPDREASFATNVSIESIRNKLRVNAMEDAGHWIYHREEIRNVRITTRGGDLTPVKRAGSLRKCFSDPHLRADPNPFLSTGIEARLTSRGVEEFVKPYLTTLDVLVWPKPLAATHILVLHECPSHSLQLRASSASTKKRTTYVQPIAHSRVIECPINNLVFMANVPNVPPSSRFPNRQTHGLVRVLLGVPHLDTFPELLVYLHSKNQAELFREILPSWMLDLMHPLPLRLGSAPSTVNQLSADTVPTTSCLYPYKPRSLSRISRKAGLVRGESSRKAKRTVPSERTVESVAADIETASDSARLPQASVIDALTRVYSLQDNLDHIGYYAPSLWDELDSIRSILSFAVNLKAKMK